MRKKKNNGVELKTMRGRLGWSQSDLATVLNIGRSACSMIETEKRRAGDDLLKKINLLKDMAAQFGAKVSPPSSAVVMDLPPHAVQSLKKRIQLLDLKILTLQERLNVRRRNTPRVMEREKVYANQLKVLEELGAPVTMRRGLKILVLHLNVRRKNKDIDTLLISEAQLIGKMAEIDHLRQIFTKSSAASRKK